MSSTPVFPSLIPTNARFRPHDKKFSFQLAIRYCHSQAQQPLQALSLLIRYYAHNTHGTFLDPLGLVSELFFYISSQAHGNTSLADGVRLGAVKGSILRICAFSDSEFKIIGGYKLHISF